MLVSLSSSGQSLYRLCAHGLTLSFLLIGRIGFILSLQNSTILSQWIRNMRSLYPIDAAAVTLFA